MNIDRLRYFAAVVETKNLREAAKLVGIAPPSMSKAISTLSEELGCELLRPEGRGIEITERGLEIYRASAVLLDEYHRFRDRAASTHSRKLSSKIRMASFEVFSSYFLGAFFQQLFPAEGVLLLEMTPGRIEGAIIDGVVDYGLTYIPMPMEKLEFTEVGRFEMNIFGNPRWSKIPFEEWPFAVPTTEVRIHSQDFHSLDLWPEAGLKRFVKYQFELLETALHTSRNGLSVLHCPDIVVKLHNQAIKNDFRLEQLDAPKKYRSPAPRKIYLVSRKGDPRKADLERKLAKFVRSLK